MAQCIQNSGCLFRFALSTFSCQGSKLLPWFYTGASKSLRIKPERRAAGACLTLYLFLNILLCTKRSNLVSLAALRNRSAQGAAQGCGRFPGML